MTILAERYQTDVSGDVEDYLEQMAQREFIRA
jgi:hypothetical protein